MKDISVHICFVRSALKNAAQSGHSIKPLLDKGNIPPDLLNNSNARVSPEQHARLQLACVFTMPDEFIGCLSKPIPLAALWLEATGLYSLLP